MDTSLSLFKPNLPSSSISTERTLVDLIQSHQYNQAFSHLEDQNPLFISGLSCNTQTKRRENIISALIGVQPPTTLQLQIEHYRFLRYSFALLQVEELFIASWNQEIKLLFESKAAHSHDDLLSLHSFKEECIKRNYISELLLSLEHLTSIVKDSRLMSILLLWTEEIKNLRQQSLVEKFIDIAGYWEQNTSDLIQHGDETDTLEFKPRPHKSLRRAEKMLATCKQERNSQNRR
eukprot:TRINITY_DN6484_c0_g1_i4.p1 TRINITY_DN6484_c0_g1~~TRINITY_DN6484_c0_g1_i4.p1  ORF type:complete len:234 (-),score=31.81 TRINITY_DN6484_c0_g1_i4:63-764(-)